MNAQGPERRTAEQVEQRTKELQRELERLVARTQEIAIEIEGLMAELSAAAPA
jgi:uncharacterized protein Yka (UPF0111/DUF47 family)